MNITVQEWDRSAYFCVKYYLASKVSLYDAAWNVAVGQSVGNPSVRSRWETDELIDRHCCKIVGSIDGLKSKKEGFVEILFPIVNIDFFSDGIAQILCMIAGGQVDIDSITKCHVVDIEFASHIMAQMPKPAFGITGTRNLTDVYDKPLLGGIIKPKTGMSVHSLVDMTKELIDGGVNFIKEDEILANPSFCSLEERVWRISDLTKKHNIIYCFCINSDPEFILKRVQTVLDYGGNGIHINVWSGLGSYMSIRRKFPNVFVHFQKSGDAFFTNPNNQFAIYWNVICKLAVMSGVDSIHAGMWGGYKNNNVDELQETLKILRDGNVIPALSCGMNPGLVKAISNRFGIDYMANVGGAIHGHPMGTVAGTMAMKQAIDGKFSKEYYAAIDKWGIVE